MKLYLASVYGSKLNVGGALWARMSQLERNVVLAQQHHLDSFHYVHRQLFVDIIRKDQKKIFLDSGAFTAFTKGAVIDLKTYCDYIRRNHDIIQVASVLDSIGDAHGTYENQVKMEREGIRPLPCFHYGDDERYLEHYIANYEYITIGGMVPVRTPQLKLWLDRIWGKYLTDADGRPKLKVHGFGMTDVYLMERYPWYSVDSSTWVQSAFNGGVTVPGYGNIAISDTSPARKVEGRHIDNVPPIMREEMLARIRSSGFKPEDLRTQYLARWIFNIWAFQRINEMLDKPDPRFHAEQMGLF